MTIQEQIEVMQHFANGGKVGFFENGRDMGRDVAPSWDWFDYEYYIIEEPKKIPLDASDLTPTTWIRCSKNQPYMVNRFDDDIILFSDKLGYGTISYGALFNKGWEYSTSPHKFEWRKCEKEA